MASAANEINSLKHRVEELEQVHRLAESLNSILTVQEMLEAIADCFVRLCGAESASIVLFSPDDATKTIVRAKGSEADHIDHALNTVVAGWILSHRKPLVTKDIAAEFKLQDSPRTRSHGPVLAFPLQAAAETIGFVNLVNSKGGRQFSDDDVRVGSIIAPLASQSIHRAKMFSALWKDNLRLQETLNGQHGVHKLSGNSRQIQEVRDMIRLVAPKSSTVLLIGETGTGKEIAARAIHVGSPRCAMLFVAINCAAIPENLVESELFGHERGAFTGAAEMRKGKFETAHGGTLFLDEISAMPLLIQSKLLRVLEGKRICRLGSSVEIDVDVRLIAATNQDLRKAVDAGGFREDLYQRLNVVPILLAPLRDRAEDIPLLAEAFLLEFCGPVRHFAPETLSIMAKMEWKGNIRELRNAVERLSILTRSPEITPVDLQVLDVHTEKQADGELAMVVQRLLRLHDGNSDLLDITERHLITLALDKASGNVSQAARLLGIDRNAVLRRAEKYGLKSPRD